MVDSQRLAQARRTITVIEGGHGSTSANLIGDQKIQLSRGLIQVNYGCAVLLTPSPKNQKI
jgi:hypothetical protein